MSSLQSQIENFDPNGIGQKGKLFGFPFTPDSSRIVVLPVPWEVTVSYQTGTSRGPRTVLDASPQLDFYQPDIPDAWQAGLGMEHIPEEWISRNENLRNKTEAYIQWLEEGAYPFRKYEIENILAEVNKACSGMNEWVYNQAKYYLDNNQIPVVLGGDHSSPLGLIKALNTKYEDFGILQIDAHADLRKAYEGFTYSHASIMYNVLQETNINHIVQVGIRDICEVEADFATTHDNIHIIYDQQMQESLLEGTRWSEICNRIVNLLPSKVYISFDIDGLDPKLCPSTGTPVPGGLDLAQVNLLVKKVVESGREIIGFDLCEVSPSENNEWDGNVGARLLYRLCNLMAVSKGILHFV